MGKILVDILELLFFQTAFVLWIVLKVGEVFKESIADVESVEKFGQVKDIVEPKLVLYNLFKDILIFVIKTFIKIYCVNRFWTKYTCECLKDFNIFRYTIADSHVDCVWTWITKIFWKTCTTSSALKVWRQGALQLEKFPIAAWIPPMTFKSQARKARSPPLMWNFFMWLFCVSVFLITFLKKNRKNVSDKWVLFFFYLVP